MEVYLIRHTTPKIEKGVCYGQSDIPLAETFSLEASKILTLLPESFDSVYSSPMTRCHKLAQIISAKQEIITDKRLLEMNFGNWEMKKWDQINEQELNSWMKDFVNVIVPGGENFVRLNTRVNSFIDYLLRNKYKNVGIVTHAGVIRCIVARVLEISLKNAFKIPSDYSGITKINLNEDNCFCKIEYLNSFLN